MLHSILIKLKEESDNIKLKHILKEIFGIAGVIMSILYVIFIVFVVIP